MIAWMAVSALFAALAGLSARAAESAAREVGRPVRWIWLVALLTSALAPAVVWLTGLRWPGLLPWGDTAVSVLLPSLPGDVATSTSVSSLGVAPSSSLLFDQVAQALWLTLSLAALCWFCWAWRRLGRARASWRPALLRDQRVLLSARSGPAVIGLYRPSIVLPKWVLTETASVQRMILLHEQEHARAGDHVLLALAPLFLVALPWNLPLWWQARRLRLAIELDCDARVLRHGVCAREYGTLLLELARAHGSAAITGASLVEPRTFLERRILAMSRRHARFHQLRVAAAGAATLVLAVAACESTTAMSSNRQPEPVDAAAVELSEKVQPVTSRGIDIEEVKHRPLVVIDDVVVGRHGELKPMLEHMSIASVEVMKGAAAVARFGPEGADGAIIIRRKAGERQPGDPLLIDKQSSLHEHAKLTDDALIADKLHARAEQLGKLHEKVPPLAKIEHREMLDAKADVAKVKQHAANVVALEHKPPHELAVKGDIQLHEKVPTATTNKLQLDLTHPEIREKPLLFIDGQQVDELEVRALDLDRIDSIEVLKGNAAVTRYGDKARFGVIRITTKRND